LRGVSRGRGRSFLLDEPTSCTDIRANDRVEQALLDYAQETGCTLVFSSHAPSQALRLGTRVVALDGGTVAETGAAADVLRSPQMESTQAFLRHWRI
jgi:ABC-type glutathione transport system ATPase component